MRIDAHQHFWKFDPVRDSWINDQMKIIQRDFAPEDLKPLLDEYHIDGCIAVQADQSEAESKFLLDHASRHEFIKGVVGWVDLQSENIEERLEYFSQFRKMKGFRHVLQGEKQRDFMLRHAFVEGIRRLKRFNYTYDILIYPDQLPFTEIFVKLFPDQPFIIDHIAKPYIKSKEIDGWKRDIGKVANHDNVYCKISGMVTEADWKSWKKEDFIPYLDVVVEAFGPERIVFGSDWPVCLLAASYGDMLKIVTDYFATFSSSEQALFFGGNAAKFYNV